MQLLLAFPRFNIIHTMWPPREVFCLPVCDILICFVSVWYEHTVVHCKIIQQCLTSRVKGIHFMTAGGCLFTFWSIVFALPYIFGIYMCINGTYVVGYPIVYQMHIMNEGVIFGPVITKSNTIKHDRNENRSSKFKTFGVSTCSNIRNFVYYFFCAQIMSFVKPVIGGQQALKFSSTLHIL